MLERRTAETFVELADTLVAGFDVIDLLHTLAERCTELLGIDAVGIVLADQRGALAPVAATSHQTQLLELFALQADQGPCLHAYHTGHPVICPNLTTGPQQWPAFAAAARRNGFTAVHALPMRLRDQRLGAVNLFATAPGGLTAQTTAIAQALADVATIGILHQRALHHTAEVTEQLQGTHNSHILIEQAKGILAEHHRITPDQAFTLLRDFARTHHRTLTEVATAAIDHTPDTTELRSRRTTPR